VGALSFAAMTTSEASNNSSWSPTCEWEIAKIRRRPQRHGTAAPRGGLWVRMSRRSPSKPLAVLVEWRGGSEAWVKVTARGTHRNYPGYATIADIVLDINNAH
jgi:hypothetical protein